MIDIDNITQNINVTVDSRNHNPGGLEIFLVKLQLEFLIGQIPIGISTGLSLVSALLTNVINKESKKLLRPKSKQKVIIKMIDEMPI